MRFSPERPIAEDAGRLLRPEGLLGVVGVDVARTLLQSGDAEERARGVERLGAIGTDRAFFVLLEALETGLVRDAASRLAAVRALSARASDASVREYLTRELLTPTAGRKELAEMQIVRATAALALAKLGTPAALEILANAVNQRGPAGAAATDALLAYPPSTLDPFLFEIDKRSGEEEEEPAIEADDEEEVSIRALLRPEPTKPPAKSPKRVKRATETAPEAPGRKGAGEKSGDAKSSDKTSEKTKKKPRAMTLQMATFLGRLGDLRARPALKEAMDRKIVLLKAEAALALARLGDTSISSELVRWSDGKDPLLQRAGAEALVLLSDAAAGRAVEKLVEKTDARVFAIGLSERLPRARLEKIADALKKAIDADELDGEVLSRAVFVTLRGRGPGAVRPWLKKPKLRDAVVVAMGRDTSDELRGVVELGLAETDPTMKTAFLEIGVYRAIVNGERSSRVTEACEARLASKKPDEAAFAAFALVAMRERSAEDLLGGKSLKELSLPIVVGVARAAPIVGGEALASLAGLLAHADARDPKTFAAGVGLLDDSGARVIPRGVLLELVEGGGALAPLAARALPQRDDGTIRTRVKGWLDGPDAVVRAHVVLGLGVDDTPSNAALLVRSYRREVEPIVRRAAIRALSRHRAGGRERVLEDARDLDPDREVRSLARAAIAGRRLELGLHGKPNQLVFVRMLGEAGALAFGRYVDASGIAVPVVAESGAATLLPSFGQSGDLAVSPPPPKELP